MMSKYNLLIETYSGSEYNKSCSRFDVPFDDFNGMISNMPKLGIRYLS